MAIESVLEAACGIQEVYSLPEVSLLSHVTWRFYVHTLLKITIIMKNGIPLRTSKILVTETWALKYIYGCGTGGKVTIKLNVFTSSP